MKVIVPVAADKRIHCVGIVVPQTVCLECAARTACRNRNPSEPFRFHTADIASRSARRRCAGYRFVAIAVRIVIACSRPVFCASCKLYFLRAVYIHPASSASPQVSPEMLHAEHLHTVRTIVGTPEHASAVHGTGVYGRIGIASAFSIHGLAVGALAHHDEQILDQQPVRKDFGVPVVSVGLRVVDFRRSVLAYHVGLPADRAELA